jgi:hypothetical protein
MSKKIKGRKAVIEAATQAVMSDRNADYAPPEENFRYDTAIMMVLVKVARIQASPHLVDHLVDIAGYAACAGDVMPARSQVEEPVPEPEPVPEMSESERVDAEGVPATYEGAPGLYVSDGAGGVFYGGGGRKIAVTSYGTAVKAGVLVLT